MAPLFKDRSGPGSGGLETGEKPVEWSVKGSGEYLEGTVWGGLSMVNGPVQVAQEESPAATAAERAGCWVVPVSAFLLTCLLYTSPSPRD